MRIVLLLLALCIAPLTHAESLLDRLPSLSGGAQPAFLPPDEAFGLEVSVSDGRTLLANFRVAPSYYLYRDKVKFSIKNGTAKIRNINMPQGELKQDPNFGEMMVFHQSFQAEVALVNNSASAQNITLEAEYQGCSDNGLCYPPINKEYKLQLPATSNAVAAVPVLPKIPTTLKPAAQTDPAATPALAQQNSNSSENGRIAQIFQQKSFWLVVTFFFGAGLLLALTPCVFPMIPILSGIIVGRGQHVTKMHGFLLSLAYVLGMALTYAAVGIAAGLSGSLLSNALQTPGCWAALPAYSCCCLYPCSAFMSCNCRLPCKASCPAPAIACTAGI